jgi:hypothetical protein
MEISKEVFRRRLQPYIQSQAAATCAETAAKVYPLAIRDGTSVRSRTACRRRCVTLRRWSGGLALCLLISQRLRCTCSLHM